MNEGVRITIEEWAGDNGLSLSDDQVLELAEAIDTAYEMSFPTGYGVDRYESQEKNKIRRLEWERDILLRYLESKGFHCIIFDNRIERFYMVGRGEYACSEREVFR